MYYYKKIKNLSDKKLKKYIKNRIEELALDSKTCNEEVDTIGYDLDFNPKNQLDENKNLMVDIRNLYNGYIPKGMRIVYGLSYDYDQDGLVSNDGKYYYLDTEDYIYEFCKEIQKRDMLNEFELFYYLQDFIKKYFGLTPTINRENMFKMLYKDENNYYKPVNEHGLSWFKKKGNAMCTEYAVVAQNILSFFGMDTYMMIAKEKIRDNEPESHAFNFVSYTESETGKEKATLIDFATPIPIYDLQFKFIGEFPFLGKVDNLDEDFFNKLNDDEEELEFPEYCYLLVGDGIVEVAYTTRRKYYVSHNLTPDPETIDTNKVLQKKNMV